MKTLPEVLLQLQAEQAAALIQTGAAASYPISRETVNDLLEAGVEAISLLRGVTFNVTSIQVVRLHHGPDRVTFNFTGPPCFPRSGDSEDPSFTLECARGYAEEYLKLLRLPGNTPVEVIDPFK